ncbi:MAG TPA: hydantoinase/oxoprolinase family protein [Stellaceae bacterium]|nr:hydantoinase/oxoprolinase family protein [Stellaceae bacterium]
MATPPRNVDPLAGNRLAVDIGGTFTDVVLDQAGRRSSLKVLTTPGAPEQAVLDGIAAILGEAGLAPGDIGLILHGTTLATNAIIERKGAVTGLIATEGFRDTLDIAYESRFDQYDIFIEKTKPLVPRERRFTVPERVDVEGAVALPLDEAAVAALVPVLRSAGIDSVAIAFMHSYANPDHERRVRDILADLAPDLAVSLSSEVCPEVREYERTSTAVANAYVQPLMAGYLARLGRALTERGFAAPVYLMTSGGGLTTLETAAAFPIRLVESGPAGGAILAAGLAARLGERKALSFDMGGTTAKICLIEDFRPVTARFFEVDRAARFLKGSGLPLRIPVIEMVEIGAGGGSIARTNALGMVTVGPDSAGSEPGPACYGRGGVLPTVTDADLLLGRVNPEGFAGGRMTLDITAAGRAMRAALGEALDLPPPMLGYAVTEIVDETMANAARVHAVERGEDAAGHTLIAFGGAAPLHAARLAEKLAIHRVVIPVDAGVGSAVGFLEAPVAYEVVRSRYMRLGRFDAAAANQALAAMAEEALAVVLPGAGRRPIEQLRRAFMRYVGQGHEIAIGLPDRALTPADAAVLRQGFEAAYAREFARIIPGAEIEVLSWSLVAGTATPEMPVPPVAPTPHPAIAAGRRAVTDTASGALLEVPVYARADLVPGASFAGPALVVEDATTTYVSPNFTAAIDRFGNIVLDAVAKGDQA